MKKLLAILVCGLMALSLVACSGGSNEPTGTTTPEPTETAQTGSAQMGVGQSTTISASDFSEDAEGRVQFNVTYALLVLNADGTIAEVKIDVAQNTGNFDGTGTVTSSEVIPTKLNRGDDYGMRGSSPIGAEWFEQAAAFEEYCVGKTVEEVLGMELDTENHGGPVDLTSSCTISVAEFLNAIEDAASHLKTVEGAASYHLGSSTTLSPTDASEDGNGRLQVNTTYVGFALDADGNVVCMDLDVSQQSASFDASGVVVASDVIESKQDRGADYGMAGTSPIGAEWDAQALAFEDYCVGQTLEAIASMELDTENHGGPVDLATSCTISVSEFLNAIAAAD